jgi:hypothetical protein
VKFRLFFAKVKMSPLRVTPSNLTGGQVEWA